MKDNYLELIEVSKQFGQGRSAVIAVDNISLTVNEGELVTLLGPSGCGKTTTLRMIAGFEIPSSGMIKIDGEVINALAPNKRPTTMVFQNYALFPHMTVLQNISYGLQIHRVSKTDIMRRSEEVMRMVGLTGMGSRYPSQLSGGQQQRVSLARSLVMEPKVLLMDEPLSNLDAKMRVSTRVEIRKLQKNIGITSVYVTHDQEEAMTLSDRVIIMHNGVIQQVASPQEIYSKPVNTFVADFVGKANLLKCEVIKEESETQLLVNFQGSRITVPMPPMKFKAGEEAFLLVRPECVILKRDSSDAESPYAGKVEEVIYLGSEIFYEVNFYGKTITVDVADPQNQIRFEKADTVRIIFKEKSLHLMKVD